MPRGHFKMLRNPHALWCRNLTVGGFKKHPPETPSRNKRTHLHWIVGKYVVCNSDTKWHASNEFLHYSDSTLQNPNHLGHTCWCTWYIFIARLYHTHRSRFTSSLFHRAKPNTLQEYLHIKKSHLCGRHFKIKKIQLRNPMGLAVYSKAAIEISRNLNVIARYKHCKDALHFFRHPVDHRTFHPTNVCSKFQRADRMTKWLYRPAFRDWCKNSLWIWYWGKPTLKQPQRKASSKAISNVWQQMIGKQHIWWEAEGNQIENKERKNKEKKRNE